MEIDFCSKDNDGWTFLHIAALCGQLNLCKTLVEKYNSDVNLADNNGCTALHFSTRNGSYELVKYFLSRGSDINLKVNDGCNYLHISALYGHLDLCKMFINEHKLKVNMTDNYGFTVLHFSARNGSYKIVKYFLERETDIHLKTYGGKNCLHIAARNLNYNLCKVFIDKHNFDVHMTDNDGWIAIHYSAKNGSHELFTFFAEMGTDVYLKTNDGKNCLHIAALYGHLDLCRKLISKFNFDLHMTDNNKSAALHYAARNGSFELVACFFNLGSDFYLKTNDGKNCLLIAALHGHLHLCKVLADIYKFDVHRTDNAGWTALHYSARFGNYESVAFLAGLGIDINLNTNDGKNCLYIAAIHGHINLCKALINERNFDMHMANNDGWVALHFSARNGSYELVTFFTSVGIDVNLKTNDEKNCLHIAALYGHLNLCKKLKDKFKLDVHITDNDGWTALHFSARNGSYELVPYFVELKIDIQLKANDGKNCLHIAALYGHLNLCKIFVDKHRFNVHDADNDGLHFIILQDMVAMI